MKHKHTSIHTPTHAHLLTEEELAEVAHVPCAGALLEQAPGDVGAIQRPAEQQPAPEVVACARGRVSLMKLVRLALIGGHAAAGRYDMQHDEHALGADGFLADGAGTSPLSALILPMYSYMNWAMH